MEWLCVLLSVPGIVGAAIAVYKLHHLCLWLEERGWIYYVNKKSSGSSAGCFVELQKALEPQAAHVIQIKEEKRRHTEGEAPGKEDPPTRRSDSA